MTATRTAWDVASDLLDPPTFDTANDPYPTPGALERRLNPAAWDYPHLDLIDDHLVRLENGTLGTRGLMILLQPRAGKSKRCARCFPLWYLRRHPTHGIALGTYAEALGAKHSRWVRNTIARNPELGLTLAGDSKAADDWELTTGGGMIARGVGGGLTGHGGGGVVIDDPVKNREEAESPVMRDRTWDWWTDDVSTRLTRIDDVDPWALLIMTSWHEDDLRGRLLAREPEHWTVLSIPALAEENDPLGRDVGQVLMPDRYGPGWIAEQQKRLGSYSFSALYQQRPSPAEGGLFKRHDFRYWSATTDVDGSDVWRIGDRFVKPSECWRFATVDLAISTKTSADWTVVSTWAVTHDGELLLLDRRRARVGEAQHWSLVRDQRDKWGLRYVGVESRQFGTKLVYEMGRSRLDVRELKADVDKFTRALPAQVRLENHHVWWPSPAMEGYGWVTEEWEPELLAFPSGAHDDQVDTFAYACGQLAIGRRGPRPSKPEPATPDEKLWASVAARRKTHRRSGVIGA